VPHRAGAALQTLLTTVESEPEIEYPNNCPMECERKDDHRIRTDLPFINLYYLIASSAYNWGCNEINRAGLPRSVHASTLTSIQAFSWFGFGVDALPLKFARGNDAGWCGWTEPLQAKVGRYHVRTRA
jgi:hypothetical protein